MNDYVVIIFRAFILYFALLLIFRFMGKREIGQLSILDLVVVFMIGDMAVMAIDSPDKPLLFSLYPILVLAIIQIVLAYFSMKSQRFREVMDGRAAIIISQGKIDEKEMKRQRYNFDDLLIQLREKNIVNIENVEYAILEPTGKLSVIEKKNVKNPKDNTPFPLVIDGVIQEESLASINKSDTWLRAQLQKRGYPDIKWISICTYDDGTFYIDERNQP
ncbi:DUF421 domain-containing protein [Bacillus sp. V5-8f]|uniref:DUF421 domain-containing protein n=1 Tax=Bacillus sp. V5-8f TaxID=2053044 RepID=UPI002154FA30|nr:DUF421 domain-containing protein [Bacillus sp. V5-8f]